MFLKVGTFPPRERIGDQHLENFLESIELPLGGLGIVRCDKIPDRIEIEVGLG